MDRMKIAEDQGRDFAEKQTRRGLEWKIAWLSSAVSLVRATDVMWREVEKDFDALRRDAEPESYASVSGQFLLLAGLAVENYLKGICVKRHGAYSENGKFLFGHHKFEKLATATGMRFSGDESEFIERLEHFVLFAGRYPAPKSSNELLPRIRSDGSRADLRYVMSSDYELWSSLIKKLHAVLET